MNKLVHLVPKAFGIIALTAAGIAAGGITAAAQENVTLHIGDPAPALKYSRWLKGTPVDITGDKLYVVECWATWCGPCIAAMPHLSELAKEYEGKAVFIGCDVWEQTHAKNPDQPYESFLPQVERFVNSSANRMSYNVIADNNAQDMANGWLKASGHMGIPCTFVIKNGRIMWIGHPIKLDSIIGPILAGNFDVDAHRKAAEASQAATRAQIAQFTEATKAVKEAVDAKDYDKAFKLVDEWSARAPVTAITLKMQKFNILLDHFSETEALNYAGQLNNGDPTDKAAASDIAYTLCDKDGYSKVVYRFAANELNQTTPMNCLVLDKIALAQSKAGDLRDAVETEKKAIGLAKIEAKDSAFGGRVFDYTVTDFEAKEKEYEAQLNASKEVETQTPAQQAIRKLTTETDPAKKQVLLAQYQKDFPHADLDGAWFAMLYTLAKKKETLKKAMKYTGMIKNRDQRLIASFHTGANAAELDPRIAVPFLKKAIGEFKDMDDSAGQKNFFYNKILYYYGKAQIAVGHDAEALPSIGAAYAHLPHTDVELKTTYAQLLLRTGRDAEAFPLLDSLVRDAKGNPILNNALAATYTKLNPGKDGKAYVDAIRNEIDRHILDTYLKQATNDPAPAFVVTDEKGNTVSLADFKGKTIILDFWATWCGPCKKSFPAMQRVVDRYKSDPGVQFLFIDTWETSANPRDSAQAYLTRNHYDFRLYEDPRDETDPNSNKAAAIFGVKGIPQKFVIDGNSMTRFRLEGFDDGDDAAVAELTAMIEYAKTHI